MDLKLTTATRIGLNLLALLGVTVALRLAMSVFVPLVIAVLLASILWPAARWLNERLRLPWTLSCMTVMTGLILVLFGITFGFVSAIPRLMQDLPRPDDKTAQAKTYDQIRSQIERTVQPFGMELDSTYLPRDPEQSNVFLYVRETLNAQYVLNALGTLAWYANNWLWQCVLILFILLFLLLEGRMLSRRVIEIFGTSEAQTQAVEALTQMARSVRSYLVWRTIVNFGLALVLGITFQTVGLKQAWTWALLAAVLTYIPYLGTIVAGIPPILDAFIHVSPLMALGILVFYTALVTFEGYIIVPVVMGRSLDLNATTVMLACLFWDLVWGLPGLFLAMPLMAGIKAVCMHVPGWRPWGNLMSSRMDDEPKGPTPRLAMIARQVADSQEATVLMEEPPAPPKSAGKPR